MKNKFLKALLFPNLIVVLLMLAVSLALLVVVLTCNIPPFAHYVSYFVWAYTLTIVCCQFPKIIKSIKDVLRNNKLYQRYTNDAQLKVKVSLYTSVAGNIIFAVVHLISGFISNSLWFVSLFVYYFVLAFLRVFLLINTNIDQEKIIRQWQRYRICGIILIALNLAMGTIVFFMINHNRGAQYGYIFTIALAAYTFTTATTAVIKAVKYKKYHSPIITATGIVRLSAVLVSVLSLQTAMINAFGDASTNDFKTTMTTIVGTVVCLFVFAVGVYMVIHSSKQIYKLKQK